MADIDGRPTSERFARAVSKPIFIAEYEKNADEDEICALTWLGSKLIVSRDAMFEAIRQVVLAIYPLCWGQVGI